MNLQQLVRELHWLEWQMRKFEDKYGLRSSDFYVSMESGQLAEFDDMDHAAFQEFLEWHGLYKVWLKREKRYHISTTSTPCFDSPHHKHVHPDIKHNRIPAPDLRFDEPNLPFLIEEIQHTLL